MTPRARTTTLLLLAACLAATTIATAQSREERALAQTLLAKHGDAIVTVRATVAIKGVRGRTDAIEDTVAANGIVIDATGATVTALSNLDPSDLARRMGGAGTDLTVEHSNMRLRLSDGRELPAKIVVRDRDLDLAILRPVTAPTSPLTFIDMAKGSQASAGDVCWLVQRFGESTNWVPGLAPAYVQARVEKPRPYYVVAAISARGGMGSAAFDASGRVVGIMLMRAQSGASRSIFGMMQGTEGLGVLPAVVPAEEIADLLKQAK